MPVQFLLSCTKHQDKSNWPMKSLWLWWACWPTLSVGFDRPFTQSTLKSLTFWWATLRLPLCGGTGGGHLRVCWSFWVSVCQPSFVSPPLFDSDVVKLLYTQRSQSWLFFIFLNILRLSLSVMAHRHITQIIQQTKATCITASLS